jgi:hypothetical protein
MKKLFIICAAVMVSTATFAQTEKKATITTSTTTSTVETKNPTDYYMLKDGALLYYRGTDAQPQQTNVTLKNGTVISTNGEVTLKSGAKVTIPNNQCIDSNGKIGDCDKMRAELKIEPTGDNK